MAVVKKNSSTLVKSARLEFAEYLRGKRLASGLSQMDIAKKLNFKNAQFISNIERGIAPVPFPVLKALMQCYGISFDELADKYLSLQKSIFMAEVLPISGKTKKSA